MNFTTNENLYKWNKVDPKIDTITEMANNADKIDTKFGDIDAQLADIAVNVKNFGAVGDGVTDDTQAIIDAINSVKTNEITETVPTQGAKGEVKLPPGKYKVSSTINIPSYVKITGSGRNTTIIESYITDGTPVFEMTDLGGADFQFYCALESLTIFGRDANCIGLKIYRTSRWQVRDVMIDRCNNEGLWLERAYLGEFYSPYIRACGSSTSPGVYFPGTTANDGSHAVTFFGGEIQGGFGTGDGVKLLYGISISFFGTTFEGFTNGIALINNNAHALTVDGCYFEANLEHIVETSNTLGTTYTNNYFTSVETGGRGHIGITYAQSTKIEGNYHVSSSQVKIFDATGASTGKLESSSVRNNYAPSWPVIIDQSLIDSARKTGTVIETFDATIQGNTLVRGNRKYADEVTFANNVLLEKIISKINGQNAMISAGTTSPEGSVSATKGVYFNVTGNKVQSTFIKTQGTGNVDWKPVQWISSGTRFPLNAEDKGFMHFDTTTGKPIWWNGTGWVDATGASV